MDKERQELNRKQEALAAQVRFFFSQGTQNGRRSHLRASNLSLVSACAASHDFCSPAWPTKGAVPHKHKFQLAPFSIVQVSELERNLESTSKERSELLGKLEEEYGKVAKLTASLEAAEATKADLEAQLAAQVGPLGCWHKLCVFTCSWRLPLQALEH